MKIIRLDSTTSTNEYLLNNAPLEYTQQPLCVVSSFQSSGKGMGSNTWESEAGKNLLFSILVHPTWLDISKQYLLSMAEALALYDALLPIVSKSSHELYIKWPNDIYIDNKKVSGTRIDGNIMQMKLQDMVIGTGINVNQAEFHGDAPNPVSLLQVTGMEHSIDAILTEIIKQFEHYYDILKGGGEDDIMMLYHQRLYRSTGVFEYEDAKGRFTAELVGVAPNGIMTLRRTDGTISEYEFKEVQFII